MILASTSLTNSPFFGYLLTAIVSIAVVVYTQHSVKRMQTQTKQDLANKEFSAAGVDFAKIEKEAYERAERSNKVALDAALAYSGRLEIRIENLEERLDSAEKRADTAEESARRAETKARTAERLTLSLRDVMEREGVIIPPHLAGEFG